MQRPCSAGELHLERAAMAFKNVPFRSEVLNWDPDTLADYFKKVSFALRWLGGWAEGVQAEFERRERQRGASSPVQSLREQH